MQELRDPLSHHANNAERFPMKFAKALSLSIAGMLALVPCAHAQQQILTVVFSTAAPAPLSDWLPAGIALMTAAIAMIALRRQTARGTRLLGWMLALIAGAALLSVNGNSLMTDANAAATPMPAISLTSGPAMLDVGMYMTSPLDVAVTNNSGRTAFISSVLLGAGMYSLDAANSSCLQNRTVAIGAGCNIRLMLMMM
jgi:hypothetical protein